MSLLLPVSFSARGGTPCPRGTRRRSGSTRAAAVPPTTAFVESRVTFEGVDGERLVGTMRAPSANANAASSSQQRPPIALLAHGYMSDRNASVLVRIADALDQRLGMASLRWDFSGNGESEGRFRYGGYRREAKEIARAAAFARSRGFRVAVLAGHSKGATSVLVYAGDDHEEEKKDATTTLRVVNVAGRFDVREGVERRLGTEALAQLAQTGRVDGMPGRRARGAGGGVESFEWTLFREDLEDRLSTDAGAFCAAAKGGGRVRVLSLHCEGDADVPFREAGRFHEALGGDEAGHRLVVLPGGDHSFRTAEANEALVEEVVAWAAAEATS